MTNIATEWDLKPKKGRSDDGC